MSNAFKNRLFPLLPGIAAHFGTPFHLYDETGIHETGHQVLAAFVGAPGFREYFAVKALPNPRILAILREMGFGFDCSSIPELILTRQVGARGEDILFTSNNTSAAEFQAALAEGGCTLNLDDLSLVAKAPHLPDLIGFRYNPGARRTGNAIIGKPLESKFGVGHEQMAAAYRAARDRGATRFGLHTMLASNELDATSIVQTADMLFNLADELAAQIGIRFEFINIGGGLGIPYHPDQQPLDLPAMARAIINRLRAFSARHGYTPRLFMESGRYMTGPHGVLVTRAINHKDTYRRYIGVDACMPALMRPGMYGAYHHIDVPGKSGAVQVVDVVGSLCENNDKFAIQRALPEIADGDLIVIHDTGAHGQAMGFNYNGRLRPQELLLRTDGTVERIRRAETPDDYFVTLHFEPDRWRG
jgi:diaminopimelate decarboxylase